MINTLVWKNLLEKAVSWGGKGWKVVLSIVCQPWYETQEGVWRKQWGVTDIKRIVYHSRLFIEQKLLDMKRNQWYLNTLPSKIFIEEWILCGIAFVSNYGFQSRELSNAWELPLYGGLMAAVRPYKLFSNFPLYSSIKQREKIFFRMLRKR